MYQCRICHGLTQPVVVVRGREHRLIGFGRDFPWEQHALAIERAIFRPLSTDVFEVIEKSKLPEH